MFRIQGLAWLNPYLSICTCTRVKSYKMPVDYGSTWVGNDDYASVLRGAFLANIGGKRNRLHGYEYGVKADWNSKGKYS